MISISIDASTTMIGYSIWDEDELIKYGKLAPTIKDLEWRERVKDFIPQLQTIINEYKPKKMYAEDVPLFEKGQGAKGKKTLVQLGATQGSIIGLCGANSIDVEFIPVSTWRSNIGFIFRFCLFCLRWLLCNNSYWFSYSSCSSTSAHFNFFIAFLKAKF